MTAGRVLIARWSRRDRLAVLVVALVTALVVGTTLVVATAGTQVTARVGEVGGNTSVTIDGPAGSAPAQQDGAVVLPVARATTPDGQSVTVLGVPPGADARDDDGVVPAAPDPGTVAGPSAGATSRIELAGSDGTETFAVAGTPPDAVPPWWYAARADAVERLGSDSSIAVHTDGDTGGVPLVAAGPFFEAGIREALGVLWPVAAGATVLAAVVVFGVTRTAVRDRRQAIHVYRATGGTPRSVVGIFAARGGLVAAAGVALGWALGVILPNLAVSVATTVGVPTTLAPRLTVPVAGLVAVLLVGLVAVGVGAGALAAWPAARVPPAKLAGPSTPAVGPDEDGRAARSSGGGIRGRVAALAPPVPGRVRSALAPTLLDLRAVVPTAATLSVFVATVLVVTALGAAVAPLGHAAGSVTQPGAAHPVTSQVDAGYADALRAQGVDASPELLLFQTLDGRAYLARGANYSAFAAVSDADLVAGRAPRGPGEAVVGADLAGTLELSVGDRIPLGGITTPRLATVEVVGVYRAPGLLDDQLLVPLETGRHLSALGPNSVNLIRLGEAPDGQFRPGQSGADGTAAVVTGVRAPERAVTGREARVTVSLVNTGTDPASRSITVRLSGPETARESRTVSLQGNERTTVEVPVTVGTAGNYTVAVDDATTTLRAFERDSLHLGPVPERAPPSGRLRVTVTDGGGDPVGNATVSVGPATARTAPNGTTRIELPPPGRYRVQAAAGDRTARPRSLLVARNASRGFLASVGVQPSSPTPTTAPTARVRLTNPWDRPLERRIAVDGPGDRQVLDVRLAPGETRTITARLDRVGVGAHRVTVTDGERTLAGATYEVRGDERLVSSLATSGRYAPGSGLGQGIASVLGNLQIVLATLLGLVAVTTVGTVAAGFAAAVSARRQTIAVRRATGATPRQVLGLVAADAARLSLLATLPALVVGYLAVRVLVAAGLLTAFGITLAPPGTAAVLVGVALAAPVLGILGGVVAAVPLVRREPRAVLTGSTARAVSPTDDDREG